MLKVGKPLEGMDLLELSRVKVWPFLWRVLLFAFLVGGFITVIVVTEGWLKIPAIIGLGLMYAHGVELQHQTLHNTGFPSRRWNRFVGFFLGLPMLVSFSDYQYNHLEHHRDLGTEEDQEFFNYGYERLTDLKPLLVHLFMVRHYLDVAGFIARSLVGWTKPDVKRKDTAVKIRNEYILMAIALATTVTLSIWFETLLALEIWLVPLSIAIPTHALIELPEHWGRDHDTINVLENTRTIKAGAIGSWFTNGNNYHIEHHWLPSVPNDAFAALHQQVRASLDEEKILSYSQFYKAFLGELYRNTLERSGRSKAAV